MGLNFFASFSNGTNSAVADLVPKITICSVSLTDGTVTPIVTAANMSPVTNCSGAYFYNFTSSVDLGTFDYISYAEVNDVPESVTNVSHYSICSRYTNGGALVSAPAVHDLPSTLAGQVVIEGYARDNAGATISGATIGYTIARVDTTESGSIFDIGTTITTTSGTDGYFSFAAWTGSSIRVQINGGRWSPPFTVPDTNAWFPNFNG